MSDSQPKLLISEERIQKRVAELGAAIDRDYAEARRVHMIGILKGAYVFLSDLARAVSKPVSVDFIGLASYGGSRSSSGEVKLTKDLDLSIEDQHVLVVEDIIDTGITLSYLLRVLEQRKPASLKIATFLDKPSRRECDVEIEYCGFQVPDEFVVGYGLDFDEKYRNLRDLRAIPHQ
jgi:hypoxanthine phosphoribosyltransferase